MIDLHLHTNASDGQDTPEELAARCRDAGITVFAVTDHDTIVGWNAAAAAAAANGLSFVRGVEITAVLDGRDVHVLGYFPAVSVGMLDAFLEEQQQHRISRMYRIAERLATLGRPIDVDAVLGSAPQRRGKSVGRPQIADALIERGYVGSREEAFRKYLAVGCSAFVPPTGAPPREVVELIGCCGGIASLAHPGLLNCDDCLPSLILAGMPAIEVFHPDHDEETRRRYEALARKSGLLMTGGSDYHGPTASHGELGSVALPAEHYEALLDRLVA